jgi:hypothetical protein
MRSARHGEVQAHIAAPPQKVWALLANLDQMSQWSPECYRVQWLDGASSPATPGARFKGWNRFGWLRWTMVRWRYLLEPANGGTDLIESFQVIWLPFTARLGEDVLMRDRDRRREEAMRTTLNRIKDVAEGARTAAGYPPTTSTPPSD